MLLTNHTLTGVLLGLSIDNPALLAPTAVASHLILDTTPHFGYTTAKNGPETRAPLFIVWGALDFTASIVVTAAACYAWPARIPQILVGVIGADLPDLVYIPMIVFGQNIYRILPFYRPMIKFLGRIQWYEKPPGIITEIVWATFMLTLLKARLG